MFGISKHEMDNLPDGIAGERALIGAVVAVALAAGVVALGSGGAATSLILSIIGLAKS